MRIGVKVNNVGPDGHLVVHHARIAEEVGFDSLWLSDRVINPEHIESHYPFTADGSAPWTADTAWYESIVSLSLVAAATERIEVATGVLVAPLRDPVVVGRQMATLDVLTGGRTVLGIGVGWMREEFEGIGIPWARRGARTEEWLRVVRAVWHGDPEGWEGEHYAIPADARFYPTPARSIPVVFGGNSSRAVERSGALADGWFGLLRLDELNLDWVAWAVQTMRTGGREARRDPGDLRAILRVQGDRSAVAEVAPELAAAGVDELVVDGEFEDPDGLARSLDRLRAASAA